ncbi:phosphate/phosphite/phosphonate ABC transporter substrate-binding protein [Herminiimonas sp. KBW02]|uniref:phosphate/phosphite/phosphonate ABC transporter substrate-binding protein n=1 Tax=Herminiimonas sp. KBW02 TaxID=2153363 RepID=UPI001F275CCA|nr:phosphate/phosphite/phosphonate ABC transporter substrate-binding protein [Herminiimonas sp. KBW02]
MPRVLLLCFLLSLTSVQAAECERPARLHFSLVPQSDLQKDVESLKPLFADLQAALGIPVEVVMPTSYGAVIEDLISGAVDLARLGPAAYVSAKKQDPGISAFATVSRRAPGQREEDTFYHSILIVRKGGPYQTITALRGKKVALVDPDSTSGALIPRHVFAREIRMPLEKYFGQVVYSGAHDQSIANLKKDKIDAAFISSSTLNMPGENMRTKADDFLTLWRSAAIPRNPFVLRSGLCADIRKKIIGVFLDSGGNANENLMRKLNVTRFVPVSDKDYQIVRDLP